MYGESSGVSTKSRSVGAPAKGPEPLRRSKEAVKAASLARAAYYELLKPRLASAASLSTKCRGRSGRRRQDHDLSILADTLRSSTCSMAVMQFASSGFRRQPRAVFGATWPALALGLAQQLADRPVVVRDALDH